MATSLFTSMKTYCNFFVERYEKLTVVNTRESKFIEKEENKSKH